MTKLFFCCRILHFLFYLNINENLWMKLTYPSTKTGQDNQWYVQVFTQPIQTHRNLPKNLKHVLVYAVCYKNSISLIWHWLMGIIATQSCMMSGVVYSMLVKPIKPSEWAPFISISSAPLEDTYHVPNAKYLLYRSTDSKDWFFI